MPATAGRVRMPANNRVHSSAALQTHGIWQSAIGYDPYAPSNKDDDKKSAVPLSAAELEGENAYASFQGLLQLAKIKNSNSDEVRGSCLKCGRVGHLTFQCRNFLSVRDDVKKDGKDDDMIGGVVLEKLKGEKLKLNGNIKDKVKGGVSSEEEEEESEISESDYDSEIERIIAKKYGKKSNGKRKLSSGKKDDDDEDEEEGKKRKKRGRSKKRRSRKVESSDSEDVDEGGRGRRNKRKEKRSRRDDDSSSDDGEEIRRKRKTRQEKRRRRSHRHSYEDSSEESPERGHKRRSRRKVPSLSDSDVSVSDDSRIGRYKKRDEKKNGRKRHREREN